MMIDLLSPDRDAKRIAGDGAWDEAVLRVVASAVPGGSARWKSPDRDEGGFSWAIAFVPFGTQSFRPVTGGFAPGYAPASFQDADNDGERRRSKRDKPDPNGTKRDKTGQSGTIRDRIRQNWTGAENRKCLQLQMLRKMRVR